MYVILVLLVLYLYYDLYLPYLAKRMQLEIENSFSGILLSYDVSGRLQHPAFCIFSKLCLVQKADFATLTVVILLLPSYGLR